MPGADDEEEDEAPPAAEEEEEEEEEEKEEEEKEEEEEDELEEGDKFEAVVVGFIVRDAGEVADTTVGLVPAGAGAGQQLEGSLRDQKLQEARVEAVDVVEEAFFLAMSDSNRSSRSRFNSQSKLC